jgi:hypothetical protein
MDIHPEEPVSTKIVRSEFHKSIIHNSSRAVNAKPVITESNAQMRKLWCYGCETWK